MTSAVFSHMLVLRPARINNLRDCLAMTCTKVASMPPGLTPVVRMTLSLTMDSHSSAISLAIFLAAVLKGKIEQRYIDFSVSLSTGLKHARQPFSSQILSTIHTHTPQAKHSLSSSSTSSPIGEFPSLLYLKDPAIVETMKTIVMKGRKANILPKTNSFISILFPDLRFEFNTARHARDLYTKRTRVSTRLSSLLTLYQPLNIVQVFKVSEPVGST